MKRIFIILCVLCFVFQYISLGEEERFTVRNGIMFGMSRDEVVDIEKQNGLEEEDLTSLGEDYAKNNIRYSDVNIAGFDDGEIYYYLYQNSLYELKYYWTKEWYKGGENNDFSEREADTVTAEFEKTYEVLEETLSKKYEVIGNKTGIHGVSYIQFWDESSYRPLTKDLIDMYNIIGFKQYLVKDGDNYVEILLLCYERDTYDMMDIYKSNRNGIILQASVDYRRISKELYDEIVSKSINLQNKRNSDL